LTREYKCAIDLKDGVLIHWRLAHSTVNARSRGIAPALQAPPDRWELQSHDLRLNAGFPTALTASHDSTCRTSGGIIAHRRCSPQDVIRRALTLGLSADCPNAGHSPRDGVAVRGAGGRSAGRHDRSTGRFAPCRPRGC